MRAEIALRRVGSQNIHSYDVMPTDGAVRRIGGECVMSGGELVGATTSKNLRRARMGARPRVDNRRVAFGPKVLELSHGRYNEAVRRVDEEQLLRNLVHMRYNEIPLNLNVSSIAAQYELAGGAEARPFFLAPNPSGSRFRTFTSVLPDVNVSGANRPTVTLLPSDNGDAVQKFLTPITVETLTFLHQTSWPVSTVMRLWIERLNGVPNAASASGPQQDQIPDFERFCRVAELCQLIRRLRLGDIRPEDHLVEVGRPQPSSAITPAATIEAEKNGLEYGPRADGETWALVRKERRLVLEVNPAALDHPILEEIASILNLQPGRPRYEIVVFPGIVPDPLQVPRPPSDELQVSLRSTAQVYFYLANGVEVPCEHLEAGLVRLPAGPDGRLFDGEGHRRAVHRACMPGTQAAPDRLRRDQVPRLLVLHR